MSQEAPTTREEHLQKLAGFCESLGDTLGRAGLKPNETCEVFNSALRAECVACGIHVSGEELYALSQPPCPEHASIKIGRLRLGDCARLGCDSYFYRLTFQPHPRVNWPKLLFEMETNPADQDQKPSMPETAQAALRSIARSPFGRRLGLALAIAVLLLLVRQFYLGGRVPFLREPEHFRVDQDPNAELSK